MSDKKRRRRRYISSRWTPPSATTSAKLTRVRDPRAAVRFALDERVSWDESIGANGSRLVYGRIDAFLEDDCTVRIVLDSGETILAPTFSARLKHAETEVKNEHGNWDAGGDTIPGDNAYADTSRNLKTAIIKYFEEDEDGE